MRVFLPVLLLILSHHSLAQLEINNTDAVDGRAILFNDIKNHITIEGLKDLTKHGVSIDGGMLTYIGRNKLLVTSIKSDTPTIHIFKVTAKGNQNVYSRKFTTQQAGEPYVFLEEENDETFSNGQTLNRTRLEVKLPNTNYSGDYKVAHFEISLTDSSGNVVMEPTFISGKHLGKVVYDRIKDLPAKSKICFWQTILTYSDGGYKKYKNFCLEKK